MRWGALSIVAATVFGGAPNGVEGQIGAGSYQVAIVGDSLTTGAGIGAERAYPNVIQQLAVNERWPIRINVYAGNGDTTADGWGRIREVVEGRPDVIVIALGGNDGLQGVPPAQMQANLRRILIVALGIGAQVVLTGMEAPPNASTEYRIAFRAAFSDLARRLPVLFMPFLLEGVALNPAMNQADGIHPNAIGATRIGRQLWPYVTAAVTRAAGNTAGR